jgi:peptide/nickel transport system substrate-binding protein
VERFKALPNITVDFRGAPYLGSHQQLCFNFDSPILKHIEVRRAIAQALDINALNKIVWLGYGQVSASPIGPLLARYHDDSIKHEHYDPKQAEALLDAAGYKRGADGVRFKLRLLFNQERRAVDFVRQSLAKVGIDAVVESYDFATYVTRTYKDRAFDLTLESLSNTFDPTVGVQRLFATKAFKIGAAFSNPSHYSNPEVDQLLDAAAVEVNENQRKKEFFEFQKIVHNDVASVEFGLHPQITVAAKRVKNYAPTGEGMRGSFADLYLEK